MAESPGAAGHTGQAEIGGVGEHSRHQGSRVVRRRASAQMRETIGEACPAVNFGEQLGDAQTRQHGVEPTDEHVRGFVLDLANRADRKAFLGERGLGQLARGGERVDFAKPSFQPLGLLGAPLLETIGNGEAQLASLSAVLESVARQQEVVEGAKGAAAFDPNVARLQPLA